MSCALAPSGAAQRSMALDELCTSELRRDDALELMHRGFPVGREAWPNAHVVALLEKFLRLRDDWCVLLRNAHPAVEHSLASRGMRLVGRGVTNEVKPAPDPRARRGFRNI